LFHLINGYAIARTIGRVHYLPYEKESRKVVVKYLEIFKRVFPALESTYFLDQDRINGTLVKFANNSCCVYDNPRRLMSYTDKYLLLDFSWAQNPRYFEDILEEIRDILEFSPTVVSEGNHLLDNLKVNGTRSANDSSFWNHPYQNALCIHIRRTDFLERNISTNMMETVYAANDIAQGKGLERFVIFGDDKEFMQNLSHVIIEKGNWRPDQSPNAINVPLNSAAVRLEFSEAMILTLHLKFVVSFLITAVTSSFGWWLAFFVADQNSIYYLPDERIHGDKVPSKELFLWVFRRGSP
ncbi:hypothetical protein OSTOST_22994, partial [Ostertagia ostertagi]